MRRRRRPLALAAGLAAGAVMLVAPVTASAQGGACTDASRAAYADGGGHDHFSYAQHTASCGFEQASFMSLRKELAARPDIVTGEMDIEAGLAAVAVAYPESGFLLFDVRNPARPVFLSWMRSKACEGLAIDVDCGAYVDLSEDGKVAFVSTQQITAVPNTPDPGAPAPAIPGVEVFDVADPRAPRLTQTQPVASAGGVHTANSAVIEDGPNPGEYLFATANSFGIEVQRVDRTGFPKVVPVARIDIPEVHDMFLQRDPTTGKQLMYVAAGFTSGFYVYDVTDPENAQLLAEWDLTPQCSDDWYSHTIDVTTVNGRRILTMPAELFDNGASSNNACGAVAGNGDKPGPLWFIDITNFAALGQPGDSDETLRRKSEAALLTTWTNAAGRAAGGNSRFSGHNQQIVGDRVYLSQYHGGVVALDASAVFRGERVRPEEVGFAQPSDPTDPRPVFQPTVEPASPFISAFLSGRPDVWDTLYYQGYLIAPDMLGGLTSYLPTSRGPGGAAPTPGTAQPTQTGPAASAACTGREGFSAAGVRPAGRGLRFTFARRVARPVTIDLFRVSSGRRVTGERLVARFRQARTGLRWNGRPSAGRRIRSGYYYVRFRMRLESGALDTRRVALVRRGGRFAARPAFYRRAECRLLRSAKLERPVFGGRTASPLRIAYIVRGRTPVTVTVTRSGRVVRRFARRLRAPGRTYRLAVPAARLRRGQYSVRIVAGTGAAAERVTLVAQRL